MVVVFFRFSSVILFISLQFGTWNFIVFVFRTYFFLLDTGAVVTFFLGVAVGFMVALGLGVAVGVTVVNTKGAAFVSLVNVLSASPTAGSAVTVISPASVSG